MYRERWEERKTGSDKNRNKRKEIKEKKERDKEGKTGRYKVTKIELNTATYTPPQINPWKCATSAI
jgi:hypothetical protein